MRTCRFVRFLILLLPAFAATARAVILFETGDPSRNTTAPTGSLTNSGWQLQGKWLGFLGTPVGPNHFIAAAHVGGAVGSVFEFGGVVHTTVARHGDSNSDLVIWEVTPRFNTWAQLYSANDEAGKRFVVFGRGTQRGAAVQAGLVNQATKGWRWGDYDAVMRWGENMVADVLDADGNIVAATLANGTILRAQFDAHGGANEAGLSFGDSSGAAFIRDGQEWKLAGINYAVDGPYNLSNAGPGFQAMIFDEGGLYTGGENSWTLVPDLPSNQPGSFYLTRISVRLDWIRNIIGDPGVPPPPPVLEYATTLAGPFDVEANAQFDSATLAFRTVKSNQHRFFRIRSSAAMEITDLKQEGAELVLSCRYR